MSNSTMTVNACKVQKQFPPFLKNVLALKSGSILIPGEKKRRQTTNTNLIY